MLFIKIFSSLSIGSLFNFISGNNTYLKLGDVSFEKKMSLKDKLDIMSEELSRYKTSLFDDKFRNELIVSIDKVNSKQEIIDITKQQADSFLQGFSLFERVVDSIVNKASEYMHVVVDYVTQHPLETLIMLGLAATVTYFVYVAGTFIGGMISESYLVKEVITFVQPMTEDLLVLVKFFIFPANAAVVGGISVFAPAVAVSVPTVLLTVMGSFTLLSWFTIHGGL